MTETLALTEFLLACIAEDEDVAREVRPHEHLRTRDDVTLGRVDEGGYMTCTITSGRVLAECEAKRRIVEACAQWAGGNWGDMEVGELYELADTTLATLASVYADHPEYRDEWKP